MLSQSPKSQTRFGNYISESPEKGDPGCEKEEDREGLLRDRIMGRKQESRQNKNRKNRKSGRNVKKWVAQKRMAKNRRLGGVEEEA